MAKRVTRGGRKSQNHNADCNTTMEQRLAEKICQITTTACLMIKHKFFRRLVAKPPCPIPIDRSTKRWENPRALTSPNDATCRLSPSDTLEPRGSASAVRRRRGPPPRRTNTDKPTPRAGREGQKPAAGSRRRLSPKWPADPMAKTAWQDAKPKIFEIQIQMAKRVTRGGRKSQNHNADCNTTMEQRLAEKICQITTTACLMIKHKFFRRLVAKPPCPIPIDRSTKRWENPRALTSPNDATCRLSPSDTLEPRGRQQPETTQRQHGWPAGTTHRQQRKAGGHLPLREAAWLPTRRARHPTLREPMPRPRPSP